MWPNPSYRTESGFLKTGTTEILNSSDLAPFTDAPICPNCNGQVVKWFWLCERHPRTETHHRIARSGGRAGKHYTITTQYPYRPPQFHLTCTRCGFEWYIAAKTVVD